MKNPFKFSGFDTMISKGTAINGSLVLEAGSTTVIDGHLNGKHITVITDVNTKDTVLVINGIVNGVDLIEVPNLTISGNIGCNRIKVSGILAIKNGAKIDAEFIEYRDLVVENGAKISGMMLHMDAVRQEPSTE